MSANKLAALLALAVAPVPGSACAMNAQKAPEGGCTVVGAAKLPAGSGGERALCDAIGRAVAQRGITTAYSVEVRVLAPSMVAATVTMNDGRKLAEQKLASSDRPLSQASFERLARVLAAQVAEASASR